MVLFWHPKLKSIFRVVPLAMDRALKEIVSGIVQRSVCIACQTTKELVLKVVHLILYIFLGGTNLEFLYARLKYFLYFLFVSFKIRSEVFRLFCCCISFPLNQSISRVWILFINRRFIFLLWLQDYTLEPDETRIYNAAHLMVASLAGSLAHVTCKVVPAYEA